jgi:hypothetical protein
VRVLLAPEFIPLWDTAADGPNDGAFRLMFKLADNIRSTYLRVVRVGDGENGPKKIVSDTLVTKVLLGTVSCTPAFDTFVRNALRRRHMRQQFSEQGMRQIYAFYRNHLEEFTQMQKRLKGMGYDFPPMKLVDMALWIEGGGPLK